MKKILWVILGLSIGAVATIMMNCAIVPTDTTSICDQAPSESFICQVINDNGWRAESIASLIVDANLIAMIAGKIDKQDILYFTMQARAVLKKQHITYREIVRWIQQNEYLSLSGPQAIAIIIVSRHLPSFSRVQIISEYDREILLEMMDYIDSSVGGLGG
jgi:hypothetical protein